MLTPEQLAALRACHEPFAGMDAPAALGADEVLQLLAHIDAQAAALKEAEEELCALGAMLTNDGWDTFTIARTLDVLRIALYGGDGDGRGRESFASAVQELHALREEEAKADSKGDE